MHRMFCFTVSAMIGLTVPALAQDDCDSPSVYCDESLRRQAILTGYQVGSTGIEEFLGAGWDGGSVVYGQLGILAISGTNDEHVFVIGFAQPAQPRQRQALLEEQLRRGFSFVVEGIKKGIPGNYSNRFSSRADTVCTLQFNPSVLSAYNCSAEAFQRMPRMLSTVPLEGVVSDRVTGQGLQGAQVLVMLKGDTTAVATTDDDGRYAFDSVPIAKHSRLAPDSELRVVLNGYTAATYDLVLRQVIEANAIINIALDPTIQTTSRIRM